MQDYMFYLSEEGALERAEELTDLAADEIEHIVGRFAAHSRFAGKLRGKVVVMMDGSVEIRTCFGNKLLLKLTMFEYLL